MIIECGLNISLRKFSEISLDFDVLEVVNNYMLDVNSNMYKKYNGILKNVICKIYY